MKKEIKVKWWVVLFWLIVFWPGIIIYIIMVENAKKNQINEQRHQEILKQMKR